MNNSVSKRLPFIFVNRSGRAFRIAIIFFCVIAIFVAVPDIALAESYSLQTTPKPLKADSVTVIGDSVTLGAKLYADMESRIAKTKSISWCKVDARASRQLQGGIELIKELKKAGKLGDIVVISLSTNWYFTYEEAQKALSAIGKDRALVLVTGYVVGQAYTKKSNAAIRKLAKNENRAFVADWNKLISAKPNKHLSDNYCHLNTTSGKWYTDVIIDAIKDARKYRVEKNKKSLEKTVKLSSTGKINLVVGKSATAPANFWGALIENRKIAWSSSDPLVASVDAEGKITALSAGSTIISAIDAKNKAIKTSFTVNVSEKAVSPSSLSIKVKKLNKWALRVTPTVKVDATGVPKFSSSNSKVAKVNSAGVVTGVKAGNAKITVKYGNLKRSITVSVK